MKFLTKFFSTKNEREIRKLNSKIQNINKLETKTTKLQDIQLTNRIGEIKKELTKKTNVLEKNNNKNTKHDYNNIINNYLEEVFAITREASKRTLNMRHFDVQLLGGIVLHQGKVSEMKTGEGKTLMATLPAVLNALTSKSVHIITVNDYLASRDAEWMGKIYQFLGLSVGVITSNMSEKEKKEAYSSDITYGQNNEFGFDYLRDNLKFELKNYLQRGHFFAIVDEVDSILIDEARTPLIISGPINASRNHYNIINSIIPKLKKDIDFTIDEKSKIIILTEKGIFISEKLLNINNLYDSINIELLHTLNQALKAHLLFKRNRDYIVEQGKVIIVDEHTGRLMHGRRWSDGLHQSIEAKENVKIQEENQTLATITFQNYFRMYNKLSGMTGTAQTEAEEFKKIYNLDVIIIPTNKPLIRKDKQDLIFKTENEKIIAITKTIYNTNKKGQPILIGTVSVEKSETLGLYLKKINIKYSMLNAKKHRNEAGIIAQAGRSRAVTIATNMAGRGTDIILGGDPEFMARNIVSQKFQRNKIQIKNFGFLTGAPSLINTIKLTKTDIQKMQYSITVKKQEKITSKNKYEKQKNIQKIYTQRKKFYNKAISLYTIELNITKKICFQDKAKVLSLGGLKIIGTERHESRRIDNQLRGRAGRQGDPGESCFYLSNVIEQYFIDH